MIRHARHLPLLLALSGCAEPSEFPPRLDQEGEPCRSRGGICLDDETVRECVDDAWVDRSCDASCLDRGPAMISAGCVPASFEIPVEGCQCVPEPGACAPGETRCVSDTELETCDEGQVWTLHDCAELCAATIATPISTGCHAGVDELETCWCVAEG